MKKLLIILGLVLFFNIYATEIKLKYSSVDTSEAVEVDELISFYKNALVFFENMDRTKFSSNERVEQFKNSLTEKELYRFLYLDFYVNSRYPEFYEEFIKINSYLSLVGRWGLYTEEEIYSLSIYPKKFIDPWFNDNIRSETTLPRLDAVRGNIWRLFIEENPEYEGINQLSAFDSWVVVKFINLEVLKIDDVSVRSIAQSLIHSECLVINSENESVIGDTLKLSINMFRDKREFSKDKLYLINYGYIISTGPERIQHDSSLGINKQMRFCSQTRRVFSLSKDDEIENYNNFGSASFDEWNPLEYLDFKTSTEVISKIKELRNGLREGAYQVQKK